MILRSTLVDYCDELLKSDTFKDYCPNGLQVEGADEIKKIIAGVTASEALIQRAIEEKADAIIVHHGIFWNKESMSVVGMKKKRLSLLLEHNINLIAYHLPLDAHPVVGNNAQLAKRLGFENFSADEDMVFTTDVENSMTAEQLSQKISSALDRAPLWINGGTDEIQKVAWCTGAAQSYIELAHAKGADVFISGEISESTVHFANENNMHYFSAGHHATERYGVQALIERIQTEFDVSTEFINIDIVV